jgi:hypothetical protein
MRHGSRIALDYDTNGILAEAVELRMDTGSDLTDCSLIIVVVPAIARPSWGAPS